MGVLSEIVDALLSPVRGAFGLGSADGVRERGREPPRDDSHDDIPAFDRRFDGTDPWKRLDGPARLSVYFAAAERDFGLYFEGPCATTVTTIEDVQAWLDGCAYASDMETFKRLDVWQHPRQFEERRRGDCEDFALWAWRRLIELGYDADLVLGIDRRRGSGTARRHVWIVFRREGGEYVYEPAERDRTRAVQPLAQIRAMYVPEFGVGPDRQVFAFAGRVMTLYGEPPAGET